MIMRPPDIASDPERMPRPLWEMTGSSSSVPYPWFDQRCSFLSALALCGTCLLASHTSRGEEDEVMLTKDVGGGLRASAIMRIRDADDQPLTEETMAFLSAFFGNTACRVERLPWPVKECSVFIGRKDPPRDGVCVWNASAGYAGLKPTDGVGVLLGAGDLTGGAAVNPFLGFRFYDVSRYEDAVYVLAHIDKDMRLDQVKLDRQDAPTGDGLRAHLFAKPPAPARLAKANQLPPQLIETLVKLREDPGFQKLVEMRKRGPRPLRLADAAWTEDWRRYRKGGYLPLERAQIIPVKGTTYVFCVAESALSTLWEVRGTDAKLVWTSDGAAPPDEDHEPGILQDPDRPPNKK